jgi:hypothetical protein
VAEPFVGDLPDTLWAACRSGAYAIALDPANDERITLRRSAAV